MYANGRVYHGVARSAFAISRCCSRLSADGTSRVLGTREHACSPSAGGHGQLLHGRAAALSVVVRRRSGGRALDATEHRTHESSSKLPKGRRRGRSRGAAAARGAQSLPAEPTTAAAQGLNTSHCDTQSRQNWIDYQAALQERAGLAQQEDGKGGGGEQAADSAPLTRRNEGSRQRSVKMARSQTRRVPATEASAAGATAAAAGAVGAAQEQGNFAINGEERGAPPALPRPQRAATDLFEFTLPSHHPDEIAVATAVAPATNSAPRDAPRRRRPAGPSPAKMYRKRTQGRLLKAMRHARDRQPGRTAPKTDVSEVDGGKEGVLDNSSKWAGRGGGERSGGKLEGVTRARQATPVPGAACAAVDLRQQRMRARDQPHAGVGSNESGSIEEMAMGTSIAQAGSAHFAEPGSAWTNVHARGNLISLLRGLANDYGVTCRLKDEYVSQVCAPFAYVSLPNEMCLVFVVLQVLSV